MEDGTDDELDDDEVMGVELKLDGLNDDELADGGANIADGRGLLPSVLDDELDDDDDELTDGDIKEGELLPNIGGGAIDGDADALGKKIRAPGACSKGKIIALLFFSAVSGAFNISNTALIVSLNSL